MVAAGVPPQLISMIHNAIDTEEWAPGSIRPPLREELGIPHDSLVLGYVGRIMPEKDLDTWLRAAAGGPRQYPAAQFVLVGEGRDASTLSQLQRLATDLGIAERVYFPGYRAQLLPVMLPLICFVPHLRREGLPNSILEAMAMGLPVVTTDVAGAKELVLHEQTGFVLPQGDVSGLAQAMTILAGNAQLRQAMGLAGRKQVEQEFSFTGRLQRIEDLYGKIVGRPHASHARSFKRSVTSRGRKRQHRYVWHLRENLFRPRMSGNPAGSAADVAHAGASWPRWGGGVWADGNVGLAHRRLAIIDLRAVAAQPMSNADGSVWITFNGEIYNFRELRADLKARGYRFRTQSDTEVIIHAYEAYGRDCLAQLRGMFAFAVWDARTSAVARA